MTDTFDSAADLEAGYRGIAGANVNEGHPGEPEPGRVASWMNKHRLKWVVSVWQCAVSDWSERQSPTKTEAQVFSHSICLLAE